MRWELAALMLGMVTIPLGCLLPLSRLPPLPNDKLMHFVAFGGMGWLAARLVQPGWQAALALATVLLASWIIELLQNRVPGRRFCWRDMAANCAGIACAAALLAWPGA